MALLKNNIFSKKEIKPRKAIWRCRARSTTGQVMLLTVLLIGGTILGATTIAGYLMLQKIRIASDITNSTKAIFAADAGIEWELYRKFKDSQYPKPALSNNADFQSSVSEDGSVIKSIGNFGRTSRAFELQFVTPALFGLPQP